MRRGHHGRVAAVAGPLRDAVHLELVEALEIFVPHLEDKLPSCVFHLKTDGLQIVGLKPDAIRLWLRWHLSLPEIEILTRLIHECSRSWQGGQRHIAHQYVL